MNILILTNSLGIGGIERAAQNFAEELNKRKGISVYIGTKDINGPRADYLRNLGLIIIDMNKNSKTSIINKYKLNIVFGHCNRLKEWKNYKDLILVQEVIFTGCYDKDADINLSISNALSYKVIQQFPGNKIKTLYYPQNIDSRKNIKIDTDKFRKKHGIGKNKFVIGRVARAEPSKWDYLFIPSVKRVLRKNSDTHLLLVGAPLLYKIVLYFFKKRITYISTTSNDTHLGNIYAAMDLFFHTAERGETFGNVIAEAMFFGKPVVTHSTHFQNPEGKLLDLRDNAQIEICRHKENGFVANTPKKVATYINLLIKDKKLYAKISKNNIKKVSNSLSSKVVINQFLKIIEEYKNGKLSYEIKKDLKKQYNSYLSFSEDESRAYNIKKTVFKIIQFIYLVLRKLFKKINIDFESL